MQVLFDGYALCARCVCVCVGNEFEIVARRLAAAAAAAKRKNFQGPMLIIANECGTIYRVRAAHSVSMLVSKARTENETNEMGSEKSELQKKMVASPAISSRISSRSGAFVHWMAFIVQLVAAGKFDGTYVKLISNLPHCLCSASRRE